MTSQHQSNESQLPDEISSLYLCGACHNPVTWDYLGVLCEECSHWYHLHCQNVNSANYSKLDHSSVVWVCTNCNSKNYTTSLFDYARDSLGKSSHTNQYSLLPDDTSLDSLDESVMPKCESSPKTRKPSRQKGQPIRLINVNCQSLSSKGGAWKNLLDSCKPDIVIATETWLNIGIGDAELEMENYQIYRRDRETGHGGGVLIAVCKSLDSTRVPAKTNAEILWVRVLLTGQPDLFVGACYRPNVSDQTTIPALTSTMEHILTKSHKNIFL